MRLVDAGVEHCDGDTGAVVGPAAQASGAPTWATVSAREASTLPSRWILAIPPENRGASPRGRGRPRSRWRPSWSWRSRRRGCWRARRSSRRAQGQRWSSRERRVRTGRSAGSTSRDASSYPCSIELGDVEQVGVDAVLREERECGVGDDVEVAADGVGLHATGAARRGVDADRVRPGAGVGEGDDVAGQQGDLRGLRGGGCRVPRRPWSLGRPRRRASSARRSVTASAARPATTPGRDGDMWVGPFRER